MCEKIVREVLNRHVQRIALDYRLNEDVSLENAIERIELVLHIMYDLRLISFDEFVELHDNIENAL